MKKFKNTFGVTGSTHAINHFAELAVKEGWNTFDSGYTKTLLWFQSKDSLSPERQYTFWNVESIDGPFFPTFNISTLEGWNKAIELMKEVEPEQLYGECIDADYPLVKGLIYPLEKSVFNSMYNINGDGFFKERFKLVPESSYLEQEAKKEKKESNNISILQENGTYNIVISKEIKDKVTIKFE